MPLCELAEVIDHPLRVGSEVVRPIFVQKNASRVVVIVSIAADVIALLDNQTRLAELCGDSLSQHRAGKACANDKEIKFHFDSGT